MCCSRTRLIKRCNPPGLSASLPMSPFGKTWGLGWEGESNLKADVNVQEELFSLWRPPAQASPLRPAQSAARSPCLHRLCDHRPCRSLRYLREEMWFAWVWVLVVPFRSSTTLHTCLNISDSLFSYLWDSWHLLCDSVERIKWEKAGKAIYV